jgi:DNA-binding MarR family transcriptional regulator
MPRCKITKPKDPDAAARAEVVQHLFDYVDRLHSHFETVVQSFDLTPVQAKLLMSLDGPTPMRCLADSLGCDPSNVTGLVDRLQERRLITRVESSEDRRIKRIDATAQGRKLRSAIELAVFRDVPGMRGLSRAQVADLRDALATLCEKGRSEQEQVQPQVQQQEHRLEPILPPPKKARSNP